LTYVRPSINKATTDLFQGQPQVEVIPEHLEFATEHLTRKSLQILRMLYEGGNRSTTITANISQTDLARKLHVTRQASSVHLKQLRESGFVQVGRGFVNVTEKGLKAIGYHRNPVILIVKFAPQKQLQAVETIRKMHTAEAFRVAGDADFAIFTDQEDLDRTLANLYTIEGIVEVKTLIATEVLRREIN
jgi:DNA-binding MarR family transcriptional regulator